MNSVYLKKQQIIKTLSGNAFKVFYTLLEMSVREYKRNESFDGWVKLSYSQIKSTTGIKNPNRIVDEFLSHPDIVEVAGDSGISNEYRVNKDVVDERLNG